MLHTHRTARTSKLVVDIPNIYRSAGSVTDTLSLGGSLKAYQVINHSAPTRPLIAQSRSKRAHGQYTHLWPRERDTSPIIYMRCGKPRFSTLPMIHHSAYIRIRCLCFPIDTISHDESQNIIFFFKLRLIIIKRHFECYNVVERGARVVVSYDL